MTADSITFRPGLSTSMMTMSMDSVWAVDVSDGFHARLGHVLRDGAIGAGIGIGVAVAITAADCLTHPTGRSEFPCEVDLLLGVPRGFAIGIAIPFGSGSSSAQP